MIAILQDIFAFVGQIIPSPINLLFPYTFTPQDLYNNDDAHNMTTSSTLATFNILSYNINNVAAVHSSRHRLAIIHAISSSNSDIILLQETNVEWEKAIIAAELQFQYTHYHHPGPNDRAAGGIAVLSQYPIKNVKILDFSRDIDGSVFPILIFDVNIPIKDKNSLSPSSHEYEATIHIANIHLRPPVNLDGSAQLDTARKTEPIRVKEAKELIKQSTNQRDTENLTKHPPLDIIAGDFNENDNRGGLNYLQSLGYKDALHHVPRRKETHTWPFGNMLTLRKRLDHILWNTSPLTSTIDDDDIKLKCIHCGVLTAYEEGASDHQPVLARFAL